jgi:hypothetical protein
MKQETNFTVDIAKKISKSGLAGPAILLLEAHKPLAFLGSQLLLIAQPTVDIFFPCNKFIPEMINVLGDSKQVETLIAGLEKTVIASSSSPEAGR